MKLPLATRARPAVMATTTAKGVRGVMVIVLHSDHDKPNPPRRMRCSVCRGPHRKPACSELTMRIYIVMNEGMCGTTAPSDWQIGKAARKGEYHT